MVARLLLIGALLVGAQGMAGQTIDFNGGESLATLGFTSVTDVANVNGVGVGGSYGMQASDRFGEAALNVSPDNAVICVNFWWDRTFTNASLYLFELRGGTGPTYEVSIQTRNGSRDGLIDVRASGLSEIVEDMWPALDSDPVYVRIQIVQSTGGTLSVPDNTGSIRVWHGASADDLGLVYEKTAHAIRNHAIDGGAPYSQLVFAPQGVIDELSWSDSLCVGSDPVVTTPDIPIDRSARCCGSDAVPGSGAPSPGAGVERPRLAVPGWTELCTGGGTVDAVADLDDGERWG